MWHVIGPIFLAKTTRLPVTGRKTGSVLAYKTSCMARGKIYSMY